jgi:hypothetical protein
MLAWDGKANEAANWQIVESIKGNREVEALNKEAFERRIERMLGLK